MRSCQAPSIWNNLPSAEKGGWKYKFSLALCSPEKCYVKNCSKHYTFIGMCSPFLSSICKYWILLMKAPQIWTHWAMWVIIKNNCFYSFTIDLQTNKKTKKKQFCKLFLRQSLKKLGETSRVGQTRNFHSTFFS